MEKFIELLNEYQKEAHPDGVYLSVYAYRDGIFWHDSDCLISVMAEEFVISKKFGFIEWLVEKEKIDFEKLYDEVSDFCENLVPYPADTCLLMLLAISDTPIDLLVSVLK